MSTADLIDWLVLGASLVSLAIALSVAIRVREGS